MNIYKNNRVFDCDNCFITQDYNAHLIAVKNGGYAQGVDLVPCNAYGTYKPSNIVYGFDEEATVMYADMADGYGYAVWVKVGEYLLGYGHMAKLACRVGEKVSKGAVLGICGSSGHSTGIHCHFECRKLREGVAIKYDAKDLWGHDSFMNTDKFTWIDPTPFVDGDLPIPKPEKKITYHIQLNAYKSLLYAKIFRFTASIALNVDCCIKNYVGQDNPYRVQAYAFENKDYAIAALCNVREKYPNAFITTEDAEDIF